MTNQETIIEIDRAVFELRRGRVVQIDEQFFIHPEYIHSENWAELAPDAQLIITAKRAQNIFKKSPEKTFESLVGIDVAKKDVDLISLIISGHVTLKEVEASTVDTKQADAALRLARIAELLPTMLQISDKNSLAKMAIKVRADDILNYKNIVNEKLELVAETPLKLKDARNVRIKAFRPQNGGSEHLAIVIGDIANEPLIRVHSSCYTGDLLGSLACDCGDQLRSCIKLMNEAGGGIIIYLIQEGRGIGLINKLRAYDLQTTGLDTVEANEFLGFDDEEREFEPAAKILHSMGIKTAKLVSNNPRKAKDLEELGIKITGLVPLLVTHAHNHDYVATKAKKSGHII